MRSKKLLPVFGLGVFCVAAILLYRALSQYELEEIVESLFSISTSRVALAGLFAAGSYFSLTLFDALALRYVGAKLPYRRIALASFSALSIGHTLGVAALSSGAIRYRFYSRWGIDAGDIARIILFCAVTVGLGLNALGGLALLLQPKIAAEILGFRSETALAFGVACVSLSVLYIGLAAVLRRPVGIKQWKILTPPPKLALAQIAAGAMSFCFVAATLHALLPPAGVGYFTVAAAYVLGNVASILSHVPGGLGVMEAVVLYLLPSPAVIGALVAFRVIYFLAPFIIGALLFAAYELAQRRRAASNGMQAAG
jgi:uncharacterized membrane protein YbhN (UPF0104 family)